MLSAGRNPPGSMKGDRFVFVVVVPIAPWKWTIPLERETAAARVPLYVDHPFWRVSGVYPLDDSANQAPSSDVKLWASVNAPWVCTVTAPLGRMRSRPFAAR